MVRIRNCKKSVFEQMLTQKTVIGICAGKDFSKFYSYYGNKAIVKCVVDNNRKNDVMIDDKQIAVVGFDEVTNYIDEDSILVLSSLLYADELIPQLDAISAFDDMEVYIPQLLIDDEDVLEESTITINCESEYIIPAKIHYCWFGGKEIPDEFKRYIDTWHQKCPDYEIIRWDESNYDISKNQYMYEAYKCKKWGFVPDYARLDIVYNYGGFYLDTDVELLQSLTPLRNNRLVCGFESREYIALGLGFGAVAGNDDIIKMLHMYDDMQFIKADGQLNLVASPVFQTEYFKQQGLKCDGTLQRINGGIVLPPEYLCPIDMLGKGEVTNHAFSIHHYAGTWLDEKMQAEKKRKITNRDMLLKRCE